MQYSGDSRLQNLLVELGIVLSFPEVRALLMRGIWLDGRASSRKVLREIWAERDADPLSDPRATQLRREVIELGGRLHASWQRDERFRFVALTNIESADDLNARVACRLREIGVLQGIFTQSGRLPPADRKMLLSLVRDISEYLGAYRSVLAAVEGQGPAGFELKTLQAELDALEESIESEFHVAGALFKKAQNHGGAQNLLVGARWLGDSLLTIMTAKVRRLRHRQRR